MASYAPLLENKNDRRWPVNLIWLDTDTVLGRSSYYVQKMYADNKPDYNLQTALEPVSKSGTPRQFAVAGYDEKTREVIIKVVNATDTPFTPTLQLRGAKNIESKGRVTTLSSNSPKDENSFEEPTKISPKEGVWNGFSEKFEYVFKPNSFTIFRIKADTTK
jgi:alpha-N-arabinofuranosidase